MARFSKGLNWEQVLATTRSLALLHAILATKDAKAGAPSLWMYVAESDDLIETINEGITLLPSLVQERVPGSLSSDELKFIQGIDTRKLSRQAHDQAHLLSFLHGDAWGNNILFQENASHMGKPVATLIDWQYAMWGNPLFDLALMLASSVRPDVYQDNIAGILNEYHSTLIQSCDIDYTAEECANDFNRCIGIAGLVALATFDSYTNGMTSTELKDFMPRIKKIISDLKDLSLKPQLAVPDLTTSHSLKK
jgi:thiamine kinase-like enzyme